MLHYSNMKYIIGLILIGVGVAMIWKTDTLMKAFGRVAWAEQKLGSGGTWSFYKILGIIVIIVGFLIMSGDIYSLLDFFIPG